MGNCCCSVERRLTCHYEGEEKNYKTIPISLSDLINIIKTQIPDPNFDIYIDNQVISEDETYKRIINQRTHILILIKPKQKITQTLLPATNGHTHEHTHEQTKEPKQSPAKPKPLPWVLRKQPQPKIVKNLAANVPEKLSKFTCTITCKIIKINITTVVIGTGFVCISKDLINNPWLPFTYTSNKSDENKPLRFVNTFGLLHFFVLEKYDARNMPEKYWMNEENEIKTVLEGEDMILTRSEEEPCKFRANNSIRGKVQKGEAVFTNDKLLGIVSEILDDWTLIISIVETLNQILNETVFYQPEEHLSGAVKYQNKIESFSGQIFDKQNVFIMFWVIVHPEYVFIPTEKLKSSQVILYLIDANGEKWKLKKLNKNELHNIDPFNFFEIYKFEKNYSNVLPADFISDPKSKLKLFNSDHEIKLEKSEENIDPSPYPHYQTSEFIDSRFHGSLLFSHSKICGLVLDIYGNFIFIIPYFALQTLKLTPKKVQKIPKIQVEHIRFPNPPKESNQVTNEDASESEEFINIDKRPGQEAGIRDENEEIIDNIEINFAMPEGPALSYTYSMLGDKLLKYNSDTFTPIVIEKNIVSKPGHTFTTTPHGLVFIFDNIAMVIREIDERLPLLHSSHLFHSSVWHKDLLYVISGAGTSKVEFFDFEKEVWGLAEDLPESRKDSAVCSAGEFIYLMGGVVNNVVDQKILRFKTRWERLEFSLPFGMKGMGLISSGQKFVVFGGSRDKTMIDMYYLLDENCKHVATGELPVSGTFNNSAIGYQFGVFSILISETQVLEYHSGLFKLVRMA